MALAEAYGLCVPAFCTTIGGDDFVKEYLNDSNHPAWMLATQRQAYMCVCIYTYMHILLKNS